MCMYIYTRILPSPVINDHKEGYLFILDLLWVFSVLCLLCLCTRLFICVLWSSAGKELTSWLSFVVSNCGFVTFPLASRVRCGACLFRFLIFAPILTFYEHCFRIKGNSLCHRTSEMQGNHFDAFMSLTTCFNNIPGQKRNAAHKD